MCDSGVIKFCTCNEIHEKEKPRINWWEYHHCKFTTHNPVGMMVLPMHSTSFQDYINTIIEKLNAQTLFDTHIAPQEGDRLTVYLNDMEQLGFTESDSSRKEIAFEYKNGQWGKFLSLCTDYTQDKRHSVGTHHRVT